MRYIHSLNSTNIDKSAQSIVAFIDKLKWPQNMENENYKIPLIIGIVFLSTSYILQFL